MEKFSGLAPFSKISGKLSKYFGKEPKQRQRSTIDIEDQSESNDDTDFFSQDDSQPHFEYYKTHQDFVNHYQAQAQQKAPSTPDTAALMPDSRPSSPRKRRLTWEAAPMFDRSAAASASPPAQLSENTASFHNSRFVCAKADWHAVEPGDLPLIKGDYYEAAHCFEDGWWLGRNSEGVVGVFPSNFVEVIESSWF